MTDSMTHLMMRRLAVASLVAIACSSNERPGDPPWDFTPNIVWIVAEDLSPVIPPFGDSTITTPNLDLLAAEGVRYGNVFSPSGVCAPSRAAVATGMYPTAIGAMHMRTGPWAGAEVSPAALEAHRERFTPYEAVPPATVRMHSEHLRRGGYYTTNRAKHDYQFRAPVTAWDASSRGAHWRNRPAGQPFFSIFNLGITHESQIWARANDSLLVADDLDVPVPPYLPTTEVARRDIRRMYSNILIMDRQLGALLDELDAAGLLDSTIVFWFGDHGGPLPRQKRLLYDSGIRLPLIIRYPNGWRAGSTDDRLISFVDFLPTLVSLAGLPQPDGLDGRPFEGRDRSPQDRRYIHAAVDRLDAQPNGVRAVRDQRYKYLRHLDPDLPYYTRVTYREQMPIMQELLRLREAGQLTEAQAQWFRPRRPAEELFDTAVDPHELNNLAGNPDFADKLRELRSEADRWMMETGDLGLMPESDFLESIWPNGVQPVTAAPVAEWLDQTVTLSSATAGASIGYQLISSADTLTDRWAVYLHPVTVPAGVALHAVAHRIGYLPSDTIIAGPR
jgi:arylsulfatase A-like enzyme